MEQIRRWQSAVGWFVNKKKSQVQVIDYFNCDRPEYWLGRIKKSDWGAGQYLYELLSENKLE